MDSIEFLQDEILPYTTIAPLGEEEYRIATRFIVKYGIKPSDALHIAVMATHNINNIVSEDREYDKVEWVKRLWL